jgi:hypothetical protein
MNSSLSRIQAWRSRRVQRRHQRSLEWWERERANGKTRFVIRSALTYGLTIVAVSDIVGHLFHNAQPLAWGKGVFFTLFGVLMASSTWSDMESKYKKALNEGLQAPPSGKTPPPN